MNTANKAEKKQELDTALNEKEGQLRKLSALIIQYQMGRKKIKDIVDFKQPCVFLLRNNRRGEFIEAGKKNNLKDTKLTFEHSDGKERTINLKGSPLYKFPMGEKTFDAYIVHENWSNCLFLENPINDFLDFKNSVHNALSAQPKWEAERLKAMALNWKWLVAGIAVLLGGLILYTLLKPESAPQQTPQIIQTLQNGSILIVPPA